MGTVYAQQSAAVGSPEGGTVAVKRGAAFDSRHPVVKAHPGLFGDEPPARAVAGGRRVERATRAPGEVRRPGRGRG